MTDAEFHQVALQMTGLRLNAPYHNAEQLRRKVGAVYMAGADQSSAEYAAIRLLIGTWERIAMFSRPFNKKQLSIFFECTPVTLVWTLLQPAIQVIRQSGAVGPRYGQALEELEKVYAKWTQSKAGQVYRTEADQAVCANFV
jgi:hypothetical protein